MLTVLRQQMGNCRFFWGDRWCAAAGLELSRAKAVGSGRACQRPRTSSGAKCFSCEGALAKDPQIFKFLAYIANFFQNPRCAARGHALAMWLRLAPSALAPLGLRSAAKCAPRRATKYHSILLFFNLQNKIPLS